MEYRLPRQTYDQEFTSVITRAIQAQDTPVSKADLDDLEQILAVTKIIVEKGLPENLVLQKLPHNLGYGIFLHPHAKPIPKEQVIAPYAGEVSIRPQDHVDDSAYAFSTMNDLFLSEEEQKKFDKTNRFNPKRPYMLNLDADKKGNFTRFINHSSEPNLEAYLIEVPKNRFGLERMPIEVIYFSKRNIMPGEQLLVSYEDDQDSSYWEACGIEPYEMSPQTFMLDKDLKLIHHEGI